MKNAIYQYWNGTLNRAAKCSHDNISNYCKRIGAKHLFQYNSNWSKTNSTYYDAFRPVYDDEFQEYDNVVYMDMDIFATDNLEENIFENDVKDVGICEEVSQPELRESYTVGGHINAKNDRLWIEKVSKIIPSFDLPVDHKGRPKVFNSGVVYYTREGIQKCREHFMPFDKYVKGMEGLGRFYKLDQNYLNAMLFDGSIDTTILDNKWNAQVHYVGRVPRTVNDERNNRPCLVHVQLSGSNDYDEDKLWRVVNLPENLWL